MFGGELQKTPMTSFRYSGAPLAKKKKQFFEPSGIPETLQARFFHRLHDLRTLFS